ncbi:hypothetical protein HBI56_073910 [Parastagonospora nodorum]|nr:hypothetical protein HBH52_059240 [Parastagonospora nodorum]KAH4128606.1 hypothetical protein HBH47_030640 [Parastagonospora nodorum]KAH4174532.1 hypothetical protein HBH43_077510 [Parastagonospora nodorum]KAH4192830.1 hypothetical protein HBH42_112120 [Parastagonospora nodorum]KAH4210867.1 hypothetical protein HBI95_065510 [Parastagonospora nodorum]
MVAHATALLALILRGPGRSVSTAFSPALRQCGKALHPVVEAAAMMVAMLAAISFSKSAGADACVVASDRDDEQGGARVWC